MLNDYEMLLGMQESRWLGILSLFKGFLFL
jgi:hypothetical protein